MKKLVSIISVFLIFSLTVNAQAWLNKLGKAAENAAKKTVESRVVKKASEETNKAIDKIEGKDSNKNTADKTTENQKQTTQTSDNKTQKNVSSEETTKFESFSKYDFIPGDKVLLYEDFSQDAVGDFPALWTTNKSGEVNTLSTATGNWLNLNANEGNWWFLKPIDFPKNFIVEFDVVPKKAGGRYAVGVTLYGENTFKEMSDPMACKTGLVVAVSKYGWETEGLKSGQPKITGNSQLNPVSEEKVNHVIIWVQNRRVRIYHKGEKVLDMPTNLYDDSKFTRLAFNLYRGASCSSYVSNIKITTAAPDMRNKLLTEGKLVTYGIYFDVNKDVVKPESYGTLKEIAAVLNEVPDVKVKIVGHTDSDGSDAANLDLSKRRAASVKNELVKNFGVNGDRLTTDGAGETQPVAKNDTPTNKALNRRVEFVKQ